MDDRDIKTIRPLFIGKTIVKMAMCSNAIYLMFNDGTDITIDTEYQGRNMYGQQFIMATIVCLVNHNYNLVWYSNGKNY